MLPASTGERRQRDVAKGRPDGRTVEIQRLIGRSLRGVVDFGALRENTIYLDCDVLTADGGTRCASITGAYVALALACDALRTRGVLERSPLTGSVAARRDAALAGEPRRAAGARRQGHRRAAVRAGARGRRVECVSLVLATRNPHKLREFAALLDGVDLMALAGDVELPPETGTTFAENA